MPEEKSARYSLFAIIATAVFLRVGLALFLGDDIGDIRGGTYDQISYDALARRVGDGYGFSFAQAWWPNTGANEPTSHWSFAYTLYLVGVYTVFGYHPLAARLVQAIVAGVLMPLLVYRIGTRVFTRRIGLLAAALVAVYLYLAHYAAALMTESFYICGILWSLDAAMGLFERIPLGGQEIPVENSRLRARGVLLGVALAVTVLLRQVILPFVPLLLLWAGWPLQQRRGSRLAGRMLAMITLILVAFILPWSIRNYLLFQEVTLLNTNAGYAFFWSNHPVHGRTPIGHIAQETDTSYQELIPAELRHLNEAALEKALLRRSVGFVLDDPGRYLILSLARIPPYFLFWPTAESSTVNNLARVASAGWLVPLASAGIALSVFRETVSAGKHRRRAILSGLPDDPRRYERWLLLLFMLTYTGIHLASWANLRYRLPVDAVATPFAALALAEGCCAVRRWVLGRRVVEGTPS